MAIKITPSIPQKTQEQDRADEIQGQGVAEAKQTQTQTVVADTRDLTVKNSRPAPQVVLDESTSAAAGRLTRPPDIVQIKAANKVVANGGLDPTELDTRLKAMAQAVYSPEAQNQFIKFLDARKPDPGALTQVAGMVRRSVYKTDMQLGRLRRYLSDRGVKLYGNEKLPEGSPRVSLDLPAFRARLKQLEKAGGVIDKRAARELIGSIKEVADERDLMEAQWEVRRKIYEGKLRFAGTDAETGTVDPYEERYFRLLDEKLGGQLNPKEISFLARGARKANFDDASMATLHAAIERCRDNPEALFFAEQVVSSQIEQAKNGLTRGPRDAKRNIAYLEQKLNKVTDPAEAEALRRKIADLQASIPSLEAEAASKLETCTRAGDGFAVFIEPMLEGKLDRRSLRKDLLRRHRSGDIDEREVAGLMSACATSRTPEEFAYASMLFHTQMALADSWEEMAEVWDKLMEDFRKSLSDDTFDASGNVIETAQERRWRKRVNKRLYQQLENASHLTKELAKRASLQALGSTTRQALPKARDVSEHVSLKSQEGMADNAADDIEVAPTPTV